MSYDKTGEFAATLLNAATTAHFLHLSSRSYAQHVALGELYEGLPDLVDAVVEACQGKHQTVYTYPDQETPGGGDPLGFVSALSDYVKEARQELAQDSEIQNAVDEIASLLDTTLYKLKFLS